MKKLFFGGIFRFNRTLKFLFSMYDFQVLFIFYKVIYIRIKHIYSSIEILIVIIELFLCRFFYIRFITHS